MPFSPLVHSIQAAPHLLFNDCFVRIEFMIQFLVIGNIPFHKSMVVLSYLRHTDMTSRGADTECHPMVCTCLSLIKLLCECVILKSIIIESNPIVISRLQRRGVTGVTLDFLCSVIWFFYHLKFNSDIRTADLVQFDFYQEESNILIGVIIQPLDCRAMFFSYSLYNPNYNIGRFARCICNQFTEVVMVGILKLILDDNFSVRTSFRCVNVNIEISNTGLGFINCYLQSGSIRQ